MIKALLIPVGTPGGETHSCVRKGSSGTLHLTSRSRYTPPLIKFKKKKPTNREREYEYFEGLSGREMNYQKAAQPFDPLTFFIQDKVSDDIRTLDFYVFFNPQFKTSYTETSSKKKDQQLTLKIPSIHIEQMRIMFQHKRIRGLIIPQLNRPIPSGM